MAVTMHRNQAISEALKSAEVLFETKTINEIREIEGKTKRDIDEKKRQLRRLVGDSYRDLIESADKIVAIANTCNTILSNVNHVQGAFSQLTKSITSLSLASDKKESLRKHEELYAVGSRIKYLVDTPEMIWGCLDSHDFLEAARRYLRAHEVYNLLQSNFTTEMLARFPLLSHQWPQVHKFKQQILNAVKASLTSSAATPSERSSSQVADALAAAAVLQGLDSGATLQLYLSSRQALMANLLVAQAGDTSVEQVGAMLVEWANALQQSIVQVAELFLEGSGEDGASSLLIQALTKADQSESSGLFYTPPATSEAGDSPPTDSAQEAVSPEASAWLARQRSFQERLLPQATGQVERACSSWVASLAKEVLSSELLGSCKEASQLCSVEQAVRAAVAAWAKEAKELAGGSWMVAATAASGRAPGPEPWEQVCERVLGRRFDAWMELFHAPVLARAKEIVADSFLRVGRSVEAPIESCLAEAATATPEPAGRVRCDSWPQYSPISEALASGSGRLGSMSSGQMLLQALPESEFNIKPQSKGFRQQVHQIRQQFDTQLHATLSSCLGLLDPPPQASPPQDLNSAYSAAMSGLLLRQASSMAAGGASRGDTSGRAAELEPYIQQQCAAMATAVAQFLQTKFDSLPPADASSPSSAATVEQALLIGRLARALSTDSNALQLMLGATEQWRPQGSALLPSQQMGQRAGGRVPAQGVKYKALLPTFAAISNSAFRLWAQWAAACLSQRLQVSTQQNEVLRMSVVPVSWSQTVLGGGGGAEGMEDEGEMRFSLPACPSSEAFGFLDAACQETRRAGGNLLGTEALQVLEWELLGGAIQAYQSLLDEGSAFSEAVTERGVLQLLFDVRFIRDILAGGRPLTANQQQAPATGTARTLPDLPDPSVSAAIAERRREGGALEALLQSRLDPIDWATYEPYLWANVERYYHRCSVLLGTLVQLQRTYSEAAGKVQPSQELNPLDLLPVVPRFQYLPISAPTHNLHTAQARNGAANASMVSAPAKPPSLDESYSFTNLGKTVRGGSLASTSAATGDSSYYTDAGLTASTLGALQAKLQVGGLGTFGTLLGDKAAEMTAMAQLRFGDIGLADIGSGITSGLLSSFAKGVGGRTTVPGK